MDGEIRKHLKEIRDFKGKLANHQCNANNQTAHKNIDSLVKETKRHETMIESMAWSLDSIRRDNIQIEERVTDLQFRSVKINLIFTGLGGESKNETTEYKLREFLENELDIKHFVDFSNVHSFGRYQWGRCR